MAVTWSKFRELIGIPYGEAVPGWHTQYPSDKEPGDQIDLVIGLDFGTAFTKIVIGETRRAYAIPFGDSAHPSNKYLLPGILTIGPAGDMSLGVGANGKLYTDLKMNILNGVVNDESFEAIVAFLALALRRARGWFLTKYRKTYELQKINWSVNVGLPTKQYHDEELNGLYNRIVRAAWHASTYEGSLTIDRVRASIQNDGGLINPEDVGTFPEFVAQVLGYVRSPARQDDLHLLVDVGAGTFDVAMFNVHKDRDGDRFPIFAGRVEQFGVQMLHRYRVGKARESGAALKDEHYVEGSADAKVASTLGLTRDELRRIDGPFIENLRQQIIAAKQDTHRRYPNSPRWRNDQGPKTVMPLFLCGGGARSELYATFTNNIVRDNLPCRLTQRTLGKPDRLVAPGVGAVNYDRLSVAYGLSHEQFDIGTIVPQHELDDLDHQAKNPENTTCPQCHGSGGPRGNDCTQCNGRGWV